jgi:hypothetical protein
MLGVTGGMHGCQRSLVRRDTLTRAAGMASAEGENLLEFVPSDTSIESLREDDSVHS